MRDQAEHSGATEQTTTGQASTPVDACPCCPALVVRDVRGQTSTPVDACPCCLALVVRGVRPASLRKEAIRKAIEEAL